MSFFSEGADSGDAAPDQPTCPKGVAECGLNRVGIDGRLIVSHELRAGECLEEREDGNTFEFCLPGDGQLCRTVGSCCDDRTLIEHDCYIGENDEFTSKPITLLSSQESFSDSAKKNNSSDDLNFGGSRDVPTDQGKYPIWKVEVIAESLSGLEAGQGEVSSRSEGSNIGIDWVPFINRSKISTDTCVASDIKNGAIDTTTASVLTETCGRSPSDSVGKALIMNLSAALNMTQPSPRRRVAASKYLFVTMFPNFFSLFINPKQRGAGPDTDANKYKVESSKRESMDGGNKHLDYQYRLNVHYHQVMKDYALASLGEQESDCGDSMLFRVTSSREEVSDIITDALTSPGTNLLWKELPSGLGLGTCWNLLWTWSQPRFDADESLLAFQRVNRFRNTRGLTRKDLLKKNVQRFCSSRSSVSARRGSLSGGDSLNLMPLTFVLPQEFNAFVAAFSAVRNIAGNKAADFWIMKPIGLSRGRGISVVNDIGEVSYADPIVIHKYLTNPLLFMGYLFDLR